MAVRILTDSASDVFFSKAVTLGVDVLPLTVRFGDTEYQDGVTLDAKHFYELLTSSATLPTTSLLSPLTYTEKFEELTKNGDSVVCITLSSKLSGCYQSAMLAAQDFENVFIVDSLNASLGEHMLVERAVQLRDAGTDAKAIAEILDREKMNLHTIALLDTLEYLKKGGRISAAVAFAGKLLSVKPVICIDDGEVKLLGQARGSKAGNNLLTEFIDKTGAIDFDRPFTLAYTGTDDSLLNRYIRDHAALFEDRIDAEHLPVLVIGCSIGTHIGPGAIGIAYFSK